METLVDNGAINIIADELGDACDDDDGLSDLEEDDINSAPFDEDSDDDGRGDAEDNCPNTENFDQTNTDNADDGGDACDFDDDNDGLNDFLEDLNSDGILDPNETDPKNP